jgi:hypothetical protein
MVRPLLARILQAPFAVSQEKIARNPLPVLTSNIPAEAGQKRLWVEWRKGKRTSDQVFLQYLNPGPRAGPAGMTTSREASHTVESRTLRFNNMAAETS